MIFTKAPPEYRFLLAEATSYLGRIRCYLVQNRRTRTGVFIQNSQNHKYTGQ